MYIEPIEVGGQVDPAVLDKRRRMAERYAEIADTRPTGVLSAFAKMYGKHRLKEEQDAIDKHEQSERQKLAESLANGNPDLASAYGTMTREQLAKEMVRRSQPAAPVKLSEGETLYDPNTRQSIYTAPKPMDLPSGYMPAPDGSGVQPIPGTKEDIERKKAQTERQSKAVDARNTIKLVDEMVGSEDGSIPAHPGFETSVGMKGFTAKGIGGYIPFMDNEPIPGTHAADFTTRLEQIRGKQFKEAYETLKGGGQITEIESQKAEQAISRMNTSQSEAEFIAAAREFQESVREGMRKLGYNEPQAETPQTPTSSNVTATNPETGEKLRLVNGQWVPM